MAAQNTEIIVGDGRMEIEGFGDGSVDVLIIDAFNSDAIPLHLLTREAFASYEKKLSPRGVMLVHISSRYFDLRGVVRDLAATLGKKAFVFKSVEPDNPFSYPSLWAVIDSPSDEDQNFLLTLGAIVRPGRAEFAWTDEYSNIVSLLH